MRSFCAFAGTRRDVFGHLATLLLGWVLGTGSVPEPSTHHAEVTGYASSRSRMLLTASPARRSRPAAVAAQRGSEAGDCISTAVLAWDTSLGGVEFIARELCRP